MAPRVDALFSSSGSLLSEEGPQTREKAEIPLDALVMPSFDALRCRIPLVGNAKKSVSGVVVACGLRQDAAVPRPSAQAFGFLHGETSEIN